MNAKVVQTGSLSVLAGLAAGSAQAIQSEVQYQILETGGRVERSVLASDTIPAAVDALISFYSKHKYDVSADELKAIEAQFGSLPTDAELQEWINSPKTVIEAARIVENDGEGFMNHSVEGPIRD
jgi:hypothetical protein